MGKKMSFSILSSYPNPVIDKIQLKFTSCKTKSPPATPIDNESMLLWTPTELWSKLQSLSLGYILCNTC